MNKELRFADGFKQDAQKHGYVVSEVAERLGMGTNSQYTWKAQFSKSLRVRAETSEQAAAIKRLRRELARVMVERDVIKEATAYFACASQ